MFSVARRFDPGLDAFLIADAPDMDAFPIPGGFGTRQEMHNGRLHRFILDLPASALVTSVCTGSWIYGAMGLLDGFVATNRKEAGPLLRRAGWPEADIAEVARVMEYSAAYEIYRDDVETVG